MGMGEWTGWCLPWAAILWARLHNGERATLLLNEFRHTFMTAGRATTHDAMYPGFTVFDGRPDVMQIEAGLGAAAAVIELLAHTAGGVLYVFPAVPNGWDEVRFDGIRAEGAFLVSAERAAGRTRWVRVFSTGRARLKLASPYPGQGLCVRGNRLAASLVWPVDVSFERDMEPGEVIYVTAG